MTLTVMWSYSTEIVANAPARDTSYRRGASPCFWDGSAG